jgi:hypothetical protein
MMYQNTKAHMHIQFLTVREAATEARSVTLADPAHRTCFIFGPESAGLQNSDCECPCPCHVHVHAGLIVSCPRACWSERAYAKVPVCANKSFRTCACAQAITCSNSVPGHNKRFYVCICIRVYAIRIRACFVFKSSCLPVCLYFAYKETVIRIRESAYFLHTSFYDVCTQIRAS